MDKNAYKMSDEYDAIFKELLTIKKPSISLIQKRWKLSFEKAEVLYEELCLYNDEVFLHGTLHELSFEEEPPTVARIMKKFNVSYILATKIYDFYMGNC